MTRPLARGAVFTLALMLAGATRAAPAWRLEPGPALALPRAAHQATALADRRLLVSGGCSGTGCTPAERAVELLPAGSDGVPLASMHVARIGHAAARLADGRVLVAGGWTGTAATATAERFDPATQRFDPLPDMATARMDATLTPLVDGGALVIGGAVRTNEPLAGAELLERGGFMPVGPLAEARAHHAAVRLADGRVLVLGGLVSRGRATASAEIYDPRMRRFTPAGAMQAPRCKHAAVLLRDARVLVVGGSLDCNERRRSARTELFDPRTGRFTPGPTLRHARYKIVGAVAVTAAGEVVVAGDAPEVEVWAPGTPGFVTAAGSLGAAWAFSTATALADGTVRIAGGYDGEIRPTAQTWVLRPAAR